jgi:hypothetical protein
MHALLADFLTEHPECSLRALGARENRDALDLAPFGHAVDFVDAAASPAWVERYHAANRARFPGVLALPGWVLVDLYLMPAAIGMITCPARFCDVRAGDVGGLGDDDEAIAAAYYAAPSIVPGTVVGVSLISLREGIGAAGMVKALTLGMLRARSQRGIAQWSNRSLRVHTRLGPLVLTGPVPGAHGKAGESFGYTVDVSDPAAIAAAMRRPGSAPDPSPPEGARWIPVADAGALADLLARAASGERVVILPPGLAADGRSVLVRLG